MKWKQLIIGMAAMVCTVALAGCSGNRAEEKAAVKTKVTVFAAASMTETLSQIAKTYEQEHPDVELVFNFDSSGTLKKQIQNGADCDLFISAAQKQMNQLDKTKSQQANPDQLDFIDSSTRVNLLENKVVLVAPEGNPKQIQNFRDMAQRLTNGSVRLVMGNSDVPVGQYTQKILSFYGVDEQSAAQHGNITYGSNVKEVTTQVREGSADCGVIYCTDAFSAKLTPLDQATPDMCGQVIYPAALLKNSRHPEEARAFLQYLQGDEAMSVFESVGFSRVS